jgi:hypothetical protein
MDSFYKIAFVIVLLALIYPLKDIKDAIKIMRHGEQ